ncbi:hypothetical protein BCR34DRAFT_472681 [Clohesyomyces aquaticus]|uniref:RNI-like protein n=1 Tax=Clohesyomyces aquaticus TaxID=1231657 RepID=A0A1Y2AAM7_9PLEO|nr:hypothetical protein BCR34DRAFT_472681 [Clohesyomyces aquaticus]
MSINIDESIMEAPRRHAADFAVASLAKEIALLLHPTQKDPLGSLIRYEKDIVKLRRVVIKQRKRTIENATKRKELGNMDYMILRQGPWDPINDPVTLKGPPSFPMPVKIAEPEALEPFFEHLRLGGSNVRSSTAQGSENATETEEPYYGTKTLEFQKGVLYSDRRMDLCKMVLGPPNIGALLESLKSNEFVTHFLLGNNLIGPHGAKCIADFVHEYPNRMETWYLAGNCIDAQSFELLVDEWVESSAVTNIWLKRNPLLPAASDDVFRLITKTPNLRTLDLDQTEIGDAGVADSFSKLAKHDLDKPLSLRHLYLNGLGIGVKAAIAIAKYVALPNCRLESLYVSNNPLGSAGVEILAAGLRKNRSLSRLTLASVGMWDDGAITLCAALSGHPCLKTLDIGQSYATLDLETRYNWITDRSAPVISDLITSSPQLTYLEIGPSPVTHTGLVTILEAVLQSSTLLFFAGRTIHPQSKSAMAVSAGQKYSKVSQQAQEKLMANVQQVYGVDMAYGKFLAEEKRWLVNATDVRKIDSVYRNRDAMLARRGLKKLDKWWDKDDKTLEEVMKGAVGPVCTKRLNIVGPVCTRSQSVSISNAT